jgi:hypothetical protein
VRIYLYKIRVPEGVSMDATRTRLSFAGDWLMAAAFLVGTVLVALLIVRELRIAGTAPSTPNVSTTPAAIPVDAASVPALALGEGLQIRVGDAADDALARLGAGVTLLSNVADRGPLGARQVRSYQLAGTKFILVLEPFERGGAIRVAGIYLQ